MGGAGREEITDPLYTVLPSTVLVTYIFPPSCIFTSHLTEDFLNLRMTVISRLRNAVLERYLSLC